MSSRSSRAPGGNGAGPAMIDRMNGIAPQKEGLGWSMDTHFDKTRCLYRGGRTPAGKNQVRFADNRAWCPLAGHAEEPGTDGQVLEELFK